jgi:hypothetical protein
MANELLKGRYSMRTFGYTIDDTLSIPRAKVTDKATGVHYPGPVKVLEPITALAVVGYDGIDGPNGGVIYGKRILRRMSRPAFVPPGADIAHPFPHVRWEGTSALAAILGSQPAPMDLKTFDILPISRYWIEGPENLTGRAIMFVKHGSGPLTASDISVLNFYFVLEEKLVKPDAALKIAFLATDTRYFVAPFAVGAGPTIQSPTPFIEWGIQTRVHDEFPEPAVLAGGDQGLRKRIVDFAQLVGLQLDDVP